MPAEMCAQARARSAQMRLSAPPGVWERVAATTSASGAAGGLDLELLGDLGDLNADGPTDGPEGGGADAGVAAERTRVACARLLSPSSLRLRSLRAAVIPAASTYASAHALATFYTALSDGRLVPAGLVEAEIAEMNAEIAKVNAEAGGRRGSSAGSAAAGKRWVFGFELAEARDGESSHAVLGHTGGGGSQACLSVVVL